MPSAGARRVSASSMLGRRVEPEAVAGQQRGDEHAGRAGGAAERASPQRQDDEEGDCCEERERAHRSMRPAPPQSGAQRPWRRRACVQRTRDARASRVRRRAPGARCRVGSPVRDLRGSGDPARECRSCRPAPRNRRAARRRWRPSRPARAPRRLVARSSDEALGLVAQALGDVGRRSSVTCPAASLTAPSTRSASSGLRRRRTTNVASPRVATMISSFIGALLGGGGAVALGPAGRLARRADRPRARLCPGGARRQTRAASGAAFAQNRSRWRWRRGTSFGLQSFTSAVAS